VLGETLTDLFLHRHSGIIGYLLSEARECIENRGFATIRIPDERKQLRICTRFSPGVFRGGGAHGWTAAMRIRAASSFLIASFEPRTPISTGSPSGARRMIFTRVPGTSPSSRSRVSDVKPDSKLSMSAEEPAGNSESLEGDEDMVKGRTFGNEILSQKPSAFPFLHNSNVWDLSGIRFGCA
jgi:hypothetical protein